jgi:N6-adenosine-specific RNA methylase IME4
MMQKLRLRVNPGYEALLPKLSEEEYEALKKSIEANGLYMRIVVNSSGTILDGHHRFQACTELGIEPVFEVKDFPDPLLERKFVIETNLKRRQLTAFQRIELSIPLLEIERQLAEKRMKAGKELPDTLVPIGTRVENGKATEIVAAKVGVSPRTYYRAQFILANAEQCELADARVGEKSINRLYKEVKARKNVEEIHSGSAGPLPTGEFSIVYADPPWPYEFSEDPLRSIDGHYPTMTLDAIKEFGKTIPFAASCVLFLWSPVPKLREALEVLGVWGFEYRTAFMWVKDKIGMGYYCRSQGELLLVGVKGDVRPPPPEARSPAVVHAPRRGHSQKPDEFYQIIESMYPAALRLELFARSERQGWISWGNQV